MGAAVGRLAWDLMLLMMLTWAVRRDLDVTRVIGAPVAVATLLAALTVCTGLAPSAQALIATTGLAASLLAMRYVTREEFVYLMAALRRGDTPAG